MAAPPTYAGPLTLSAGDILISNHGGNNVQRLQPDGTVTTLVTTSSTPIGLAFDPSGNLYVNTGNDIVRFDKSTGVGTTFFAGSGQREGLSFATANNNFYSVNFGGASIDQVNLLGGLVRSFTLPDGGTPVGISARGTDIVIGDYSSGNIYLGSTSSTSLKLVGNVDAFATYGVDIDAAGNIYANDFNAGTVDKFAPSGSGYSKSTFISGLVNPANGLSIGDDGSFTISEYGGSAISVYNSDGTLRHRFTGVASPDELVVYAPVREGISSTPEPASLTLLGVGAVSLAGYSWRKRRRGPTAPPCS